MNTSEMKESTGRLRQESSCPKGRDLTPGTPEGKVLKTDLLPRAARDRAPAAHAQQPPQRLLPDALHWQEDRGPPETPRCFQVPPSGDSWNDRTDHGNEKRRKI